MLRKFSLRAKGEGGGGGGQHAWVSFTANTLRRRAMPISASSTGIKRHISEQTSGSIVFCDEVAVNFLFVYFRYELKSKSTIL
jgi:hypothetical protein